MINDDDDDDDGDVLIYDSGRGDVAVTLLHNRKVVVVLLLPCFNVQFKLLLWRECRSKLLHCTAGSQSKERDGAFTSIDRHCIYWWC